MIAEVIRDHSMTFLLVVISRPLVNPHVTLGAVLSCTVHTVAAWKVAGSNPRADKVQIRRSAPEQGS